MLLKIQGRKLDAADVSEDCNASSVTSDESGRSPHGLVNEVSQCSDCLLYTSPSPRDGLLSRMPSSA